MLVVLRRPTLMVYELDRFFAVALTLLIIMVGLLVFTVVLYFVLVRVSDFWEKTRKALRAMRARRRARPGSFRIRSALRLLSSRSRS